MKNIVTLISAVGFMACGIAPAYAGDVQIQIDGVVPAKGDLYVSLQKKDEFMQPHGSYGEIIPTPVAGEKKLVMKNVAPGEYSVSVWHDTDGDKKFSMQASGMPADGWSILNAQKLFAMPKWEEVKFTVPENGTAITLKMIYPK
jgi:uncharacterized protein (DUF2141 family)